MLTSDPERLYPRLEGDVEAGQGLTAGQTTAALPEASSQGLAVTVVREADQPGAVGGSSVRMRVNGETEAQMHHARERKAQMPDTTVDEVWPIDNSLTFADTYVWVCTNIFLYTKLAILFVPTIIFVIPFACSARLYALSIPYGADKVERNRPGFAIFVAFSLLCLVPLSIFWILSRAADGAMYYVFGIPYMLFSKDGWARRSRGIKTLKPHMGG